MANYTVKNWENIMGPIAKSVQEILGHLTSNINREGIQETPVRVEKYLREMTSGYGVDPASVLKCFKDGAENYDEMVFEGNIPFASLCEHHMVPFFGVAHIAYVPNDKVVGLSKLPRVLEVFARRLQVQERMTCQIADALNEHLSPKGVGVTIRARHMCVEMRGIKKPGVITYTSALRGCIKDGKARDEFLHFVALADQRGSV
jgi:GTP cyclohydrolase IA